MHYSPINNFRRTRGKLLRLQIEALARKLGRKIVVLDVGGQAAYWSNIGVDSISRIDLLNYDQGYLSRDVPGNLPPEIFARKLGDARELSDYADHSVDLVHSNSVIEHVGAWADMASMAREVMRVGQAGWIQTPAWEFPFEPHFKAPFVHWFGQPLRRRMMSLSIDRKHRGMDVNQRRRRVDHVNLLSKQEVRFLFDGRDIVVERYMLLPKSYIVRWMPEGLEPAAAPARGVARPLPIG